MKILFEFVLVSYCEKRKRIDHSEFVARVGIPTSLFTSGNPHSLVRAYNLQCYFYCIIYYKHRIWIFFPIAWRFWIYYPLFLLYRFWRTYWYGLTAILGHGVHLLCKCISIINHWNFDLVTITFFLLKSQNRDTCFYHVIAFFGLQFVKVIFTGDCHVLSFMIGFMPFIVSWKGILYVYAYTNGHINISR